MTLGARLREARKRGGYTQKELAQKIGAKHNSVSNWENGLNMPDPATIECICNVLDITPNYLLMGTEYITDSPAGEGFTYAEMDLMRKYRGLDRSAKGAIDALLNYYGGQVLAATVESIKIEPAVRLVSAEQNHTPHFDIIQGVISTQSVAAGTGTYLDPDSFEPISVIKNDMTGRASFYVPVTGNSMEPRYHDGDILIIEKTAVRRGEIGIFTLDGSGYVKQRGECELISLNPEYMPIPMNDDITCNGKVIGVLEPEWLID